MKKTILYLLLFSYTTIVIKPLLPSLCDFAAHIFWYSEHMSTVHYEHGKYHVHDEYADAAKKENPGKNNNGLRQTDDSKEYLIANKTFSFSKPLVIKNNFGSYISDLLTSSGINDYPPPRA